MENDHNNGNGDKLKMHERMAVVETNVKTIMQNHLPHLQSGVDRVNTKLGWFTTLLISNLVGLVIALALLIAKLN